MSNHAATTDNTAPKTSLLTIDQVAERMGVQPTYIRHLIFKKRIPYIKLGKYVRIDETDLDAFIEAGRVECAD